MIALLPLLLVLSQPPAETSGLNVAGRLARENRFAEAITELNATLQREPQAGEAVYVLLARCYQNAGQPEDALRTLQAGLRANPSSPRLKLHLGEVIFGLKADSQEAGKLLSQAAEALPRDAEAHHYYAQWAFLNDKENECAANERTALALPGLNDLALLQMYTLLGLCEDKLDRPAEAESAFSKALVVNRRSKPFDPAAAIQFARFLSVSGKEEQARQLVHEIASHAPGFGPVHLEIAKQFEKSGKFAQAVDEARRALAREGNDSLTTRSARSVLAKCLFALGQKKEANEQRQLIEAESKGKSQ